MNSTAATLQKFYSEEECSRIYGIARFYLEIGQLKNAETLCKGLAAVRPEYLNGWLGLCYCLAFNQEYEGLRDASLSALKIYPDNGSANLFYIIALFGLGEIAAAGTQLGELGELFEQTPVEHADILRIYRSQLARYQNLT